MASITESKSYNLKLTEQEARLLMGIFQNPLWGREETPDDVKALQKDIFLALEAAGVKLYET